MKFPVLRMLPIVVASTCIAGCQQERSEAPVSKVEHLNPNGLIRNPAFTHAIAVTGPHRTIYVGGQNAVDAERNIVGKGDVGAQTEKAMRNLETALAAAGAGLEHVVKMNVYVVQGQPLGPGFEASRKVWGDRPDPPTISVLVVAGLAHPDFLVEINAVAVVPNSG